MSNPSPGFRDHPEHKITTKPYNGNVAVRHDGRIIASSSDAIVLQEASYPAVFYIPFKDIAFDAMKPTRTGSHCPFKGDASYWGVEAKDGFVPDVMWAYQHPYDEMTGIRDYGAFYPNKVSIEATPN